MREPSARVLLNRVDLYRYTPVQDPDGGVSANPYGAALATSVPCSVQPDAPLRYIDETTNRIVEKTPYKVLFADDYSLRANDKIVWTDSTGATRNLFVFGAVDDAGRTACFTVHAEERL